MTAADYKRLMRRRWVERFLNRKLWFTRKQATRLARYIP